MADKKHMNMSTKKRIGNIISYVLLVLISIIWITPFIFLVLRSFDVYNTGVTSYVLPVDENKHLMLTYLDDKGVSHATLGFGNYAYLFSSECNFLQWYFNTFIIALVVCVVQTAMQFAMSFVLSRFRFKLRKPMMNFMLVLGMFPGFLTMIVLYQILKMVGLTGDNALPGLILVYVASSGMGYYVIKGFLDTMPKSLDEAALVDGATRSQIFVKVIIPLCKPILIYTVLTSFMGPWGDFVFAYTVSLGSQSGMNVAAGLNSWLSAANIGQHFAHFCAGGVIVAIPVMVLFLFLQKYYVEGVTGGAVKG